MRKQAKQQLCESIEYLIQTSDTLRELLGKLGREQALDVLAQMQDLVIHAGETIEASEAECEEIIHKLENTCEIIYQLTSSLDEFKVRIHLLKELKELFSEVYDEIQKNIPGKLEILFLPYQVSMWDSLPSAARSMPESWKRSFLTSFPGVWKTVSSIKNWKAKKWNKPFSCPRTRILSAFI